MNYYDSIFSRASAKKIFKKLSSNFSSRRILIDSQFNFESKRSKKLIKAQKKRV